MECSGLWWYRNELSSTERLTYLPALQNHARPGLHKFHTLRTEVTPRESMPALSVSRLQLVLLDGYSTVKNTTNAAKQKKIISKFHPDFLKAQKPQHKKCWLKKQNSISAMCVCLVIKVSTIVKMKGKKCN